MNNWFNNVFLPSLFERAGANNPIWLSQKQTAICCQNMEQHCSSMSDGEFLYKKLWCSYRWQERDIILTYSKKNRCSTIEFSFNSEEREFHKKEHELEKQRIEKERVERIKRKPERLKKVLEDLRNKEQGFLADLSFDDNTEEDILFYTQKLEEIRSEISLYM